MTGLALPFGTFNKHKKDNFKDAQPCLFVFDILALVKREKKNVVFFLSFEQSIAGGRFVA